MRANSGGSFVPSWYLDSQIARSPEPSVRAGSAYREDWEVRPPDGGQFRRGSVQSGWGG